MAKSTRAFQAALVIGWIALGAAGLIYGHLRGIPGLAAVPVILAILIAYPFYLLAGFPELRDILAGPHRFPLCALAICVLPYLVCCCGAIPFQWMGLVRVAAVGICLGLWYEVLPAHAVFDLAFLGLTAAILLGKYFEPAYPPFHKEKLVIIGHISLYVTAILALMLRRPVAETGFGFVPSFREWRIGVLHFVYFAIIGLPLALALHAVRFVPMRPIGMVLALFLAFLWFGSLTEEFFFRGVLQSWFEGWTRSRTAGLIVTSLLFGLIHYWFRGWPWVPLGAVLGFFCGRARNQAGGIRAGVVTHALVVATWRAFFV